VGAAARRYFTALLVTDEPFAADRRTNGSSSPLFLCKAPELGR
jgi:hypothetical protein